MTQITIRPVDQENFRPVAKLKVRPEQEQFVAANMVSIAQAYVHRDWLPQALYAGDELVGFTLTAREAESGVDWIIRFMIGAEQQGKGHGKAALLAVIEYLKALPGHRQVRLSYVPGNDVAERLYRAVGFVPTGEVDDGEIVMALGDEKDKG
ncbi:MAG TPA: GNAT family N-acetyltransferase [Herpetosiphonaceae bacterium]|nr:GNAT family N-acetyltransferase [Herpetosiphonaceae bacterium]